MPLQLAHPTSETLSAFSLGQLPPQDASAIEEHITQCQTCCDTLLGLSNDDTFVGLVREAACEADDATIHLDPAAVPGSIESAIGIPAELLHHSRYQLVGLVGHGGMGDVYKAEHRIMERTVALKVIRRDLVSKPEAVERFRREVRAAARLNHPNIVAAYDAEQAGDVHFLAMEFVDGAELSDIVRKNGPLPPAMACEYARQVAEGLQYAHRLGMVHRDIKPQNLMVTPTGQVKILDFGLASFAHEVIDLKTKPAIESGKSNDSDRLTTLGTVMGTPDYLPPEQIEAAQNATIRSDIYSLGCTLYYLLSGKPPFAGNSVTQKLEAHAREAPKPLSEVRHDVPEELSDIIGRMMAKDPAERFDSPAAVAEALAPYAVEPAATPRLQASANASPTRFGRGWKTLVASVFVLAFGAIIAVATDRGRLEIDSNVDDVQVVVKQGGKIVETIDLETGSQVRWLSTGEYELELKGGNNEVKIDKTGFRMSRLGKVIVTARWQGAKGDDNSQVGIVGSFTTSDATITRNNIEIDDGGWKVEAPESRTVRLFEVPKPNLYGGQFFYRAKLKSENVQGKAYLEMWVRFPGKGEYFSKGFHNAISGTNGWAEYEIPFLWEEGQSPDLVRLNLTIVGSGTVWIKDVELRGRTKAKDFERTSENTLREIRRFEGHTGPVKSVAFSPDGKLAASASGWPTGDSTVRLWDVETGKEIRQFQGHNGLVRSVCFSHNGKWLLTGGEDKTVRLWDVATGELLKSMERHSKAVEEVAITPDDRIALSCGEDRTVISWDVASGEQISRFAEHKAPIHGVAAVDRERAITVDSSGVARLWSIRNAEQLQEFAGPSKAYCVTVSRDGSRALIGYEQRVVIIWDIESGEKLRALDADNWGIESICFTPDERFALIGGENPAIEIYDLATGTQIASTSSGGSAWSIAISPDGRYALAGGGSKWDGDSFAPTGDYAIRLWKLPESIAPPEPVARPEIRDELESLVRGARGELNDEQFRKLLQEHAPVLAEFDLAAGRGLVNLIANLPHESREKLLRKGYLKWKYESLDSESQEAYLKFLQQLLAPAAEWGFPADTVKMGPALLKRGDVGFAVVTLPDSDAQTLYWYLLVSNAPIPMNFPIILVDVEPENGDVAMMRWLNDELWKLADKPYSEVPP